MDEAVYSSDKISTGLALELETSQVKQPSVTLDKNFTIILRYLGTFSNIRRLTDVPMIPLLNQFAIGTATKEAILQLSKQPEILYLDITRQMEYEQAVSVQSRLSSCFPMYTDDSQHLSGSGILVGIVDSGIDFLHPAFQRADSTNRVLAYWDQDAAGTSPQPYGFGKKYSSTQINTITKEGSDYKSYDRSGHGTAVASIVAALSPEADLIGVATRPNTASFLCAVDYIVRFAMQQASPLVINLSYGNNYGDHQGHAITELYLESLRANGKITIVTGMGNEGNTGRHRHIEGNTQQATGILISNGIHLLNLQLWFAANYRFYFQFLSPNGERTMYYDSGNPGFFYQTISKNTVLSIQIGQSTPYNSNREIFIQIEGNPIPYGYWNLFILPYLNQPYQIDAWLPVASSIEANVEFELPTTELSLTIPASLKSIISVGSYNQTQLSIASFSGKGGGIVQKPDIISPGVDVLAANTAGGYSLQSGTSFSTPFVTAAAANLMQWGITEGRDPFLYGERLKTYLTTSARPLPGNQFIPNYAEGWGRLCANASIPNANTKILPDSNIDDF